MPDENSNNHTAEPEDVIATDEEDNSLFQKSPKSMGEKEGVSYDLDSETSDVVSEDTVEDSLKKLREKLKVCIEEKQRYLDLWQRDKADFINARKRNEEANAQFLKYANEGLITDLIPVLQSFESAFSNKEAWEKVDKNWRIGVEYIANQLLQILESNGLKQVNPIGENFDPARDEAVEFVKTENEKENNRILAVIQKGYSLQEKILKSPKVRVGEFKTYS